MLSSLFGMVRTVRWGISLQFTIARPASLQGLQLTIARPSGELMALDHLSPQVHHRSSQCGKLVRDRPRPVPWNAGFAIAKNLFKKEKLSQRSPLDDVLIFFLQGFVDGSDGAELGGQEKKEKAEYCH